MLYEAAYWRADNRPDLEAGLSVPEIHKLLTNWGRCGDCAVVAENEGRRIGAAWFRFWDDNDHSYGYVSADIPEVAIGLFEDCRGMGIGRQLLERLLAEATSAGIDQVSLSVEKDNPALNLYRSLGFHEVQTIGNAYTMVANTYNPG